MKRILPGALVLTVVGGCGSDTTTPNNNDTDTPYRPHHAQTLLFGTNDNAEVVKVIPHSSRAIVVASKARKVTLLEVTTGGLDELRSKTLFPEDTTESELTHVAISDDGTWAVLTRTKIEKDADGATTDCAGSLVFINTMDDAGFGACTNHGECSRSCPKEISLDAIMLLNREYMRATVKTRGK